MVTTNEGLSIKHLAVNSLAGILPDELALFSSILVDANELEPNPPKRREWVKACLVDGFSPMNMPSTSKWDLVAESFTKSLPTQLGIMFTAAEVAYLKKLRGTPPHGRTPAPHLYTTEEDILAGFRLQTFLCLAEVMANEPKLPAALYRALQWKDWGARIIAVNAQLSIVNEELCLAETGQRLQNVLSAIEGQYPFSLIVCMGHDWKGEPFEPSDYRRIELSSSVAMLYGSITNEMDWKDTIATFLLPGNKFSTLRYELVNMLNELP